MLSATVKASVDRRFGPRLPGGEAAGPTIALVSAGGDTNHKGQIAPEVRRNSTHLTEP